MIEVEKNFDLRAGDKERLIKNAKLLTRKTFTDIYFDTAEYDLTGRDYWLRKRNGKFELKVPLNSGLLKKRVTDQYRELETEDEIARELKLNARGDFGKCLLNAGYKPFATILTNRESYQSGKFHLDFDEMDFGFSTFEIELMVQSEKDIPEAEKEIMNFAGKHKLLSTVGHGKVIEYLLRNDKKHYDFLAKMAVLKG